MSRQVIFYRCIFYHDTEKGWTIKSVFNLSEVNSISRISNFENQILEAGEFVL
jgi:hypothetical protein